MKKKLAVIITHPIQYYSPLFKLLTDRNIIQIKVFYTWEQSQEKIYDKKFGKEIKWDIPLLGGYDYTFVKNRSKNPGSGTFNGVINPTLIKEIKEWQADAILVFGWNHHSHFKAMRYFKGKIPVYFRGDSTLIDILHPLRRFLRKIVLTFIYRYIDFAFYVGTNNKKYYLKFGLKEKQLIFSPHAIDNKRFSEAKYKADALKLRKKLGYSSDDVIILFAGKFDPVKNPIIIIEAAAQLPKIKFLFVGNGVLEEKMKNKAESISNIKFLPFQNQTQMPIIYNLCDIFILPSQGKGETWGLAVNEAMACGKAIIVSNRVGCGSDLVKSGQNGFVFETNNLDDLINKIKLSSEKYEAFGLNSKKFISDWSFLQISISFEDNILQI